MAENQQLSLNEMLKLAENVEYWAYFSKTGIIGELIRSEYRGTINGIEIRVGESYCIPIFFGFNYRYISAIHGNMILTEIHELLKSGADKRLEDLFKRISIKIRQQGLSIARKNNQKT